MLWKNLFELRAFHDGELSKDHFYCAICKNADFCILSADRTNPSPYAKFRHPKLSDILSFHKCIVECDLLVVVFLYTMLHDSESWTMIIPGKHLLFGADKTAYTKIGSLFSAKMELKESTWSHFVRLKLLIGGDKHFRDYTLPLHK